ncbi:MAG: YtxH domain-containing protein [Candidatus Dojkabacteria bacterium]|nr:YtxH domain-containing protein [Candidatus Dojkabacteria bacterium]
MSEDRTFSFLKGLLVGAIAGAAAGILLAPKSGKETREDIKNLALDFSDKATELYNKAVAILKRKLNAIKGLGKKIDESKYMDIVNDVVKEIKEDGAVTADAARNIGEQLRKDWMIVKNELAK